VPVIIAGFLRYLAERTGLGQVAQAPSRTCASARSAGSTSRWSTPTDRRAHPIDVSACNRRALRW